MRREIRLENFDLGYRKMGYVEAVLMIIFYKNTPIKSNWGLP